MTPRQVESSIVNRDGAAHRCFGCGTLNSVGLQLAFRRDEIGVWADFEPGQRYEGYAGMIHGGILATMLDEAMSWAITADGGFAVTARMNMSFRNPAPVGARLKVHGRIIGRRRRLFDTSATITCVDNGMTIAEAEGRFMQVSPEQASEWHERYLQDGSG